MNKDQLVEMLISKNFGDAKLAVGILNEEITLTVYDYRRIKRSRNKNGFVMWSSMPSFIGFIKLRIFIELEKGLITRTQIFRDK